MSNYVFSGSSLVHRQFECISRVYDAVTIRRLEAIPMPRGGRFLEVGAGNGSIAHVLADLSAPDGRVVATDIDTGQLEPGDAFEVWQHDVTTDPLPDGEFDIVHARLLLMHLPSRREVVPRLLRTLKPGGWLLTEDLDVKDLPPVLTAPNDAATELHNKISQAMRQTISAAGVDNYWGREAFSVFRDTGFVRVASDSQAASLTVDTPGYELLAVWFQQLGEPMISAGLITRDDLNRYVELIDDPAFAVASPLMVGTRGQRPPAA
jgi:ubiquinone/menaquinone biosynthesis C-methylase UbiE